VSTLGVVFALAVFPGIVYRDGRDERAMMCR